MESVLHCIALHLAPHHFILMQCFVFHSYFRSYCHMYTIYACVCPFNPIHSIARVISLFTFQLYGCCCSFLVCHNVGISYQYLYALNSIPFIFPLDFCSFLVFTSILCTARHLHFLFGFIFRN